MKLPTGVCIPLTGGMRMIKSMMYFVAFRTVPWALVKYEQILGEFPMIDYLHTRFFFDLFLRAQGDEVHIL